MTVRAIRIKSAFPMTTTSAMSRWKNFDLSHVPVYIMSEDQLPCIRHIYVGTGQPEDLFPGSSYVDKYIENPPADYDVPAEYLMMQPFPPLLTEAEKYLGYPFVWAEAARHFL